MTIDQHAAAAMERLHRSIGTRAGIAQAVIRRNFAAVLAGQPPVIFVSEAQKRSAKQATARDLRAAA